MNQEIGKKLLSILKVEQVKKDEPMKIHTTFRVGGPASYFVTPETEEEVAKVIEVCTQENVPYYIVGNGSNLLVSDQGYEGVIIQIYKQMNRVEITENEIHAQAGALLSMIANRAMEAELTGFEFAAGIPGTLGGACVMNAGAYGGEMKDVLETVTVLTRDGDVKTLTKDELELGYRTSVIAKKDYIALSAVIRLENGKKEKDLYQNLFIDTYNRKNTNEQITGTIFQERMVIIMNKDYEKAEQQSQRMLGIGILVIVLIFVIIWYRYLKKKKERMIEESSYESNYTEKRP